MSILSNHFPEVLDELNGRNAAACDPPPEREQAARPAALPRQRRVRPARSIVLLLKATAVDPSAFIRIGVGRKSFWYWVTSIPADVGRGFLVEPSAANQGDGNTYHVCLNGRQSSCECMGFLRWGHCKHLGGLQALVNRGKL